MKKSGTHTRRFYAFEAKFETRFNPEGRLLGLRSVRSLQRMARYVWQAERPTHRMPRVLSGRGPLSWWERWEVDGRQEIRLVPTQQNLWVLLHELAHAMGTYDKLDHGPAFAQRFCYLITTYAGCPAIWAAADQEGVI